MGGDIVRTDEAAYNLDLEEEFDIEVVAYWPRAILPAPPVFPISKNLSQDGALHLRKAFELLWVDPASSANRIRIFVEFLLDQFGISRTGTNKKGASYDLALADRIILMETSKPGHKSVFTAMRKVGNYGSHAGKAKFEALIDCFELLEAVLIDLVDGRRERLDKLTAGLLDENAKF
ncbi:DUF4145 domain-containing protein [Mesorhizobium sp. M1252]|uniref:DUF4145 domain-containing protein n=1 Tax=Mesorhizobium sp. M1252 TaxID=2957073 RepID=UPI00333B0FDD